MKGILRLLVATLFTALAWAANADPINYAFQVTATSGPLSGTVASGTFSFDSSIVPAGGGIVSQLGLLTDLNFTWNGITYTEATVNTGGLAFDAAGHLIAFCFGNNTAPGTCTIVNGFISGVDQFAVAGGAFVYAVAGVDGIFSGTNSFREVTSVPEPGSAVLVLTALLLLGLHRDRASKRR